MAKKNNVGIYVREDCIHVDRARILYDGLEGNLRFCESVVEKRNSNAFICILNQLEPFSYCSAK